MKEKLLVSACLLGENCKYSGGNNYNPAVEALRDCWFRWRRRLDDRLSRSMMFLSRLQRRSYGS